MDGPLLTYVYPFIIFFHVQKKNRDNKIWHNYIGQVHLLKFFWISHHIEFFCFPHIHATFKFPLDAMIGAFGWSSFL